MVWIASLLGLAWLISGSAFCGGFFHLCFGFWLLVNFYFFFNLGKSHRGSC